MNVKQWSDNIILAVGLAWTGRGQRLAELAQMLADAETAREVLIGAGLGADDDSLLDMTAAILERTSNDDGSPAGSKLSDRNPTGEQPTGAAAGIRDTAAVRRL